MNRTTIVCAAVLWAGVIGCSSKGSNQERGKLLREAALSGVAIEIALEGYRRKETHFQDGKLHGPQITWCHNGDLFSLEVFENGEMKYWREYGPDASETHRFPR